VFGLLVLGALGLALGLVLGVLGAVFSLVFGLIVLPFKLIGFAFRGLAFLLVLPFLALAAIVGVMVFGFGMLMFLAPLAPLALMAWGIWWLVKPRRAHPVTN
jgi:hypothetical protein